MTETEQSKRRAERQRERATRREEGEAAAEARRLANRARRGDPERFTLRGVRFPDDGEGQRSIVFESIDPPLEEGEVIEVVRVPRSLEEDGVIEVVLRVSR